LTIMPCQTPPRGLAPRVQRRRVACSMIGSASGPRSHTTAETFCAIKPRGKATSRKSWSSSNGGRISACVREEAAHSVPRRTEYRDEMPTSLCLVGNRFCHAPE
jgi:hypothetical protein